MSIVTIEQFKKDMEWSTLDFTEVQLGQIYDTISTDYASFVQLNEEIEGLENEDTSTCFMDCSLSETVGYLKDLEDVEIITNVLTLAYGHNGFSATLYYLNDDGMYCLVMQR